MITWICSIDFETKLKIDTSKILNGFVPYYIAIHLKAFSLATFQAENDAEIQAKEKAEIQVKKKSNIHNLYLSKHYAMYHKTWPFKGL